MGYVNLKLRESYLLIILGAFSLLVNCTSKKLDPAPTTSVASEINEVDIFRLITASGFVYYQNSSSPRVSVAENNAHGASVTIRFNSKAKSALGLDGKLPSGGSFPDSSLIVKEVFGGANSSFIMYAAMIKLPKDKNAASGWVWTELSSSGAVLYPVASGAGCVPCHSRLGHRDMVRTFGVF